VIRFKSFKLSIAVLSLSILFSLVAGARPAMAQSDDNGFNVGAEKKLNFGVNVLKFDNVPVDETSDSQQVVITTSQKAITVNSIVVKPPFLETSCTCLILIDKVETIVDCDTESLPLELPPQTTCRVGVAFEPTSTGRVDKPNGFRADFDARNSSKKVELIGIGTD